MSNTSSDTHIIIMHHMRHMSKDVDCAFNTFIDNDLLVIQAIRSLGSMEVPSAYVFPVQDGGIVHSSGGP